MKKSRNSKVDEFLYKKKRSVRFLKFMQKIEDTFFNPCCDYSDHGGDIERRNTAFHRYHHLNTDKKKSWMLFLSAPVFMALIILMLCIIYFITRVIV